MECERPSWLLVPFPSASIEGHEPEGIFKKARPARPRTPLAPVVNIPPCNVEHVCGTQHDMSELPSTMKLYHTEWCPECEMVREKLAHLGVSYEDEIVPDIRPFRKTLYKVSGQYYVPVLVDGETVLTETSQILAYLDRSEGMGASSSAEPIESNLPLGSLDERNN